MATLCGAGIPDMADPEMDTEGRHDARSALQPYLSLIFEKRKPRCGLQFLHCPHEHRSGRELRHYDIRFHLGLLLSGFTELSRKEQPVTPPAGTEKGRLLKSENVPLRESRELLCTGNSKCLRQSGQFRDRKWS